MPARHGSMPSNNFISRSRRSTVSAFAVDGVTLNDVLRDVQADGANLHGRLLCRSWANDSTTLAHLDALRSKAVRPVNPPERKAGLGATSSQTTDILDGIFWVLPSDLCPNALYTATCDIKDFHPAAVILFNCGEFENYGDWRWLSGRRDRSSGPSVGSNCAKWCPSPTAQFTRWSSAASSRGVLRSPPAASYGI